MDRANRRDIVVRPGAACYDPAYDDDEAPPTRSSRRPSSSSSLPRKYADDMAVRRSLNVSGSGNRDEPQPHRVPTTAEYHVTDRPEESGARRRRLEWPDKYGDDAGFRVLRRDLRDPKPSGGLPIVGYRGERRNFPAARRRARSMGDVNRGGEDEEEDVRVPRRASFNRRLGDSARDVATREGSISLL